MMVWHLYRDIEFCSIVLLALVAWSLESINHLYACIKTAGPKYSSWFHQ